MVRKNRKSHITNNRRYSGCPWKIMPCPIYCLYNLVKCFWLGTRIMYEIFCLVMDQTVRRTLHEVKKLQKQMWPKNMKRRLNISMTFFGQIKPKEFVWIWLDPACLLLDGLSYNSVCIGHELRRWENANMRQRECKWINYIYKCQYGCKFVYADADKMTPSGMTMMSFVGGITWHSEDHITWTLY